MGQSAEQAQVYEFSSREIKELARRFDGIFLPANEDANLPIYFVEVQFQGKPDFYSRLFAEIMVYLHQYQPENDWCSVAVFASRSVDLGVPMQYRGFLMSEQVKWVYLDELAAPASPSLGIGIVQLVVGARDAAVELTNQLMQKARQELEDEALKRKVIELIEAVLVYKFTELSREEIEAMFGLSDLKQTRVYQEGKLEGKLESVPRLLALGLSVEQIATALGLDVALVRQAAQSQSAPDTPQG